MLNPRLTIPLVIAALALALFAFAATAPASASTRSRISKATAETTAVAWAEQSAERHLRTQFTRSRSYMVSRATTCLRLSRRMMTCPVAWSIQTINYSLDPAEPVWFTCEFTIGVRRSRSGRTRVLWNQPGVRSTKVWPVVCHFKGEPEPTYADDGDR